MGPVGPRGHEGLPGEKGRREAEGSPGPEGVKGDRVSADVHAHVVFACFDWDKEKTKGNVDNIYTLTFTQCNWIKISLHNKTIDRKEWVGMLASNVILPSNEWPVPIIFTFQGRIGVPGFPGNTGLPVSKLFFNTNSTNHWQ